MSSLCSIKPFKIFHEDFALLKDKVSKLRYFLRKRFTDFQPLLGFWSEMVEQSYFQIKMSREL